MNWADFRFTLVVLVVEVVVYAAIAAPAIWWLPGYWCVLGIVLGVMASSAVANQLIRRRRRSERKA